MMKLTLGNAKVGSVKQITFDSAMDMYEYLTRHKKNESTKNDNCEKK